MGEEMQPTRYCVLQVEDTLFYIDSYQTSKLWRTCGLVLEVEFQEILLNGIRDTAEKILCYSWKVPFITDLSRTEYKCFISLVVYSVWSLRRELKKRYSIQVLYSTIKVPFIKSHRGQTYKCCGQRCPTARYGVSWKSLG
jgi:hypothetical protein